MCDLAKVGNIPEILRIEEVIKQYEQAAMPVTEYKIDGVYVRSLFIPADTLLTGKIHNFESIAILAQGTIKITNGTQSYEITAPHIMVDGPGIKRMGYAVTDCTFITVHKLGDAPVDSLASDTFEEYEQQLLLTQGEV